MSRRELALAFVICASCSGGRTYVTGGRGVASSADARIEIDEMSGGNRRVRLSVEDLPPPERIGVSFTGYNVWIVPPDGEPVPAGRLEYDAESQTGHLTALTPHEDFRVLVTVEPSERAARPSGATVIHEELTT